MSADAPTPPAAFPLLFSPLRIGRLTVRNRIVNTTHGSALNEARDLRYIDERARGGVGLIGLHGSTGVANYLVGRGLEYPVPEWDQRPISPHTPKGVAHYDGLAIPYMAKRAEVVHAAGAACFAQVYHLGNAPHAQRIFPPVAPSDIGDPYDAIAPHPLAEEEIENLIFCFAQGIRRVREAGVDAAEIHGAHGYLVNEFLSPYYNRREDQWGGSRENRVRFVLRILETARQLVGDDFPIGIRIGLDGDGRRGLSIKELAGLAGLLSPHVQYISVSGGNYSGFGDGYETAYVSPWYREPGFNVEAAAAVKSAVSVPVIVTGRIADASIAEGILTDGSADMIGMVRALIADPELPNKAREGRILEVRMCLGMSECHYIGPHRTPINCAVNAAAGREKEMEVRPAEVTKTVVVVGAGPAGMEAARVAALRGHHVYLSDAARAIGGTVRLLARDPNRRNLRDHAAFFELELPRLGVEYMLGNVVTADELVEFAPDAVIVATGGRAIVPDVPGMSEAGHLTALDLFGDDRPLPSTPRVVVVSGLESHLAGPTIAEYLADQGKEVELINEQVNFAQGAEDGTRLALLSRLRAKNVAVSQFHRLERVEGSTVTVTDTFARHARTIDEASVVVACGLTPNDELARALSGRIAEVHVIGDALAPRRLMHANLEGARVANLL